MYAIIREAKAMQDLINHTIKNLFEENFIRAMVSTITLEITIVLKKHRKQ